MKKQKDPQKSLSSWFREKTEEELNSQ